MKKYWPLLSVATIFFATAAVFQPNDTTVFGKIVLQALGIILLVGLAYGVITLIKKGYLAGTLSATGKTAAKIFFSGQGVTAILFALFLLTFWYTFGGFWTWWWNSGMFLPPVIATILIILFASCEWRKKVNNGLMFLTGIFIAGTLAINALIGWWSGGDQAAQSISATEMPKAVPAPAPTAQATQSAAASLPSPTPALAEQEKEEVIVAEYNVFTPVEIPPMKELVKFRWENAPDGCVVAVISDEIPEGKKFPCDSTVRQIGKIRKIGFASDIPGETLRIPIRYTYRPQV